VKDSVFIKVIQQLQVDAGPSDTSVVKGEPLNLLATGAVNYLWTPSTWLNNPAIANPISTPTGNILYKVTGTDATGCLGTDTIRVTVYDLEADMYVPTAFTPNGDGSNDVIRPILLGMKKLNYFKIFNRFGELVFETNQIGKGWNGIFKGKAQDMASFVWMAEGITFKNQVRTKKGNLILIR
jgi:gliding motility-associated-like protein